MQVDAWDPDGSVSFVEFLFDGESKYTDFLMPYQYTWNAVTAGNTEVVARVSETEEGLTYDLAANIYVDDEISVPPVFTSDPIIGSNATMGEEYADSIADDAFDQDFAEVLTFSKVGVDDPAWLHVASNGSLFGTPTGVDIGLNTFVVRVEDAAGLSDEATLKIVVVSGALTPSIEESFSASDVDIDLGGLNNERVNTDCDLPAWGGYHVSSVMTDKIRIRDNALQFKNGMAGTYAYANLGGSYPRLYSIRLSTTSAISGNLRHIVRDANSGNWYVSDAAITVSGSGEYRTDVRSMNWHRVEATVGAQMTAFDNGGEIPMSLNTGNPLAWDDWAVSGGGVYVESQDGMYLTIDAINWLFSWPEDIVVDGVIDGRDLAALARQWLMNGVGPDADINEDRTVNGKDFALLAARWSDQ